ncbi:T9SS type A sorting domain-containing protein [Methanococcoides sp. SA1]|nr:T9SS type A sorting domain-containing protein [Methanococcoides sp. SA1]
MKKLFSLLVILTILFSGLWAQNSAIFYNGDEESNIAPWSWGFSSDPYQAENMGYTPGTPALLWTGYNGTEGYQGIFLGLESTLDLTANWETLNLHFKVKAPKGLPADAPKMNVLIYDSRSDVWDYSLYYEIVDFQTLEDSAWHAYTVKLTDLLKYSSDINKNEISAVSFEYFDTGLDQEILIDEVYIGEPVVQTKIKVFNGTNVLPGIGFEAWGFDDNSLQVSTGDGMEGTNAIKWETSNWNWQGQSFKFDPQDISSTWDTEIVEFFVNAPAGINDLSIGFYDADGNAVWYPMSAETYGFDGNWKKIQIALKDFEIYWDSFDNTRVTEFRIENAADGVTVPELLFFDYIGLGASGIDVEEPIVETANMVFFDGKTMDDMYLWPWGYINDPADLADAGYSPGTAALKWSSYDGSGSQGCFIGLTDNMGQDLTSIWDTDSVYFMIKAPNGVQTTDSLDLFIYDSRNGDWEYSVYSRIPDLQVLNDTEWHQFAMPLAELKNFTNDIDKTDICAVSFETSTGVESELLFDKVWIGKPNRPVTMTIFNGQQLVSGVWFGSWGFSNNDLVLAANEGYLPGTPAILWETSDWDWQGKSFGFIKQDFSHAWKVDTLKMKVKAPAGINDLAFRWKDAKGTEFQKVINASVATWDGEWKKLELPLKSFMAPLEFDKSQVTEFAIIADSVTIPERILFDDIWVGNPEVATDFTPPQPPASLNVMTDPSFPHVNMILWDDVNGENGEKYTLYASLSPITDLTDENVSVIQADIAEGTNIIAHHLFYPLTSGELTYYYAMTCTDEANNISETYTQSDAFTNTGQKRAIANYGKPTGFELDGYFEDWDGIQPFVINPKNSIMREGTITDSSDCTARCYMAFDNEYLYIAYDVIDDAFTWAQSNSADWWNDESIEMFVGLYEIMGAVSHHNGWQRGEEPDYRIVFTPEKVYVDAWPGIDSLENGGDYYYFESGGSSDYYIEAKLSLDWLSKIDSDTKFTPVEGMKIPLEIQINDADEQDAGTVDRMQLGTNSADDAWWGAPNIWTFTWIGMPVITSIDENPKVAYEFSLSDNYPNPFNPTTMINYSIPKNEKVQMFIYNTLGQKVQTLVNQKQNAGRYNVSFDASGLSSGLYFYQIKAGENIQTKKMLLVK